MSGGPMIRTKEPSRNVWRGVPARGPAADPFVMGRAFGTILRRSGGRSCAIGFTEGLGVEGLGIEGLHRMFAKGLVAAGIAVIDLGACSDDFVAATEEQLAVDASVRAGYPDPTAPCFGMALSLHRRPLDDQRQAEMRRMITFGDYSAGPGELLSLQKFLDRRAGKW